MKRLVTIVGLLALGGLLIFGFIAGRKEAASEKERERPVKAPSRVSVQNGEAVVSIDQATLDTGTIKIAGLEPSTHRAQLRAYGVVTDLQELSDLLSNYAKARATAEASRKEFDRLQALHANERIVSDKAVQSAEAAARNDDATLRALETQAQQRWGKIIAQWLNESAPELQRLLQLEDVLLQVSLPGDIPIAEPPATAIVETAVSKTVPAKFISRASKSDPRLQGQSFFYTAAAKTSGLLPGMTVVVLLPAGEELNGVVVPGAAPVWWQGKAWVYLQTKAGQFARREIPTDFPVENGWFVTSGLSSRDHIIVTGAQLLLSEEFRAQIQVGD